MTRLPSLHLGGERACIEGERRSSTCQLCNFLIGNYWTRGYIYNLASGSRAMCSAEARARASR
jgi:hypothetical protein